MMRFAWLFLCFPATVLGQQSRWGHPVITLGLTPYNAVSTGLGNQPSSNGFIPGYGYYPGANASRYPWLDGPEPPSAPVPDMPVSAPGCLLTLRVPEDARVRIDGQPTAQRGRVRQFLTPELDPQRDYSYEIEVRTGGSVRTRTLRFRAGDRLTVDLGAPEGDVLPLPRRVAESR